MTKMGTPIKRAAKIATTLSVVFLFLSSSSGLADALPTAEDINDLAQATKSTIDTFLQQSFELRMQYEFSGRFLNINDKDNLYKLAKEAADRLQEIAWNQRKLKKQIEDYQGDDWDARYGSTGLWRKLSADLSTTGLSRCEIDFYVALAADQPQRNKILHNILTEIQSPQLIRLPAVSQLLKAKILALLAQTEPSCKPLAKKQFDALMVRSDMSHSTAFRIPIERINFLGVTEPGQLETMAENIARSRCSDDLELILSLTFLQRRKDPEGLEKTVSLFPKVESFFSSLALSDLSNRFQQGQLTEQNLQQFSLFELQLAAGAAWENNPQDYNALLAHLANTKKFQTPLILYVAAMAASETSPTRSVTLLLSASRLQQQKKDFGLGLEAEKIAEQAAQFAYNLFAEDPCNCSVAVDAFDNYSTIAADRVDEELEYLYSSVLRDCSKVEKSKKLLQKIAERPTGLWHKRAKLDLILQQMQRNHKQQTSQNELLEQLRSFILNCPGQDNKDSAIRAEALNIYCRSLLECADSPSAQKVLDVLDKAEETRGIQLDFFKAKAFQQIGELEQAVHYMVSAIMDDSDSLAPEAALLLSEVTENIEQFETQAGDFNEMLDSCRKLAEFSNKSLGNRQTALLLTEFLVFAADNEQSRLTKAESLLSTLAEETDAGNVDFLRCRARLLVEQRRFSEAARLWAELCRIRKSELPLTNQRSWKWWRAKYYELYCWLKLPRTQKADVAHSIEILENSFRNIPPLWAEKLNLLKSSAAAK
jgi:hypothetical protein